MSNQAIPRMRTIKQAAEYFKQQDPETQVTFWKLRELVLDGKIPFIISGKKRTTRYVNLDTLIDYFNGDIEKEVKKVVKLDGRIRKTV